MLFFGIFANFCYFFPLALPGKFSADALVCVCVMGYNEAYVTLFWATLNLLYYRKQCSLLITKPMTRL